MTVLLLSLISSSSTKLQKPVDLMQTRETHNANVSLIGTNGEFTNYTGKSVNLEETHLANSLEKVKNGSTQGSSGIESSIEKTIIRKVTMCTQDLGSLKHTRGHSTLGPDGLIKILIEAELK
ncbi:hypothetical protein LguiA_000224 [Lonicera macranthoides]